MFCRNHLVIPKLRNLGQYGQDCVLCYCNRAGTARVTLAMAYQPVSSAVMAKPLALEFAGPISHLTSRGNARQKVVLVMTTESYF
jgi:hypothetical protein